MNFVTVGYVAVAESQFKWHRKSLVNGSCQEWQKTRPDVHIIFTPVCGAEVESAGHANRPAFVMKKRPL